MGPALFAQGFRLLRRLLSRLAMPNLHPFDQGVSGRPGGVRGCPGGSTMERAGLFTLFCSYAKQSWFTEFRAIQPDLK